MTLPANIGDERIWTADVTSLTADVTLLDTNDVIDTPYAMTLGESSSRRLHACQTWFKHIANTTNNSSIRRVKQQFRHLILPVYAWYNITQWSEKVIIKLDEQEIQLSQRDRVTRYVSWNLVTCCISVRKIAF